ncbi:hypothetical protein LOZ57_005251 [Ophidiomyces ophidiicola]|uniref:uncharacterized protein n=1 Tax=Ophidiomyces ophidiicola TaxID=1387563 RepID=UPI0020C53D02|nr:uncharacterized protein LOZ57_005251 [Ophidiomyces ophidiicola]KAI1942954.1 hypothetical protein LOZ57_005251 [Ophidiomyces ophidiicola]KAI2059209.1 hypothetical protein LOZ43_002199 [Ophidiomyces ophidiicola]
MAEGTRAWLINQTSWVLDIPASDIKLDHKFTELGGNSLSAVRLKTVCQQANVRLSVESILGSRDVETILNCAVFAEDNEQPESPPCQSSESRNVNGSTKKSMQHLNGMTSDGDALNAFVTQGSNTQTIEGEIGTSMTEMQLALIHGTKKDPVRNIINYFETYPTDRLETIRTAWKTIVAMEPIFRTKFDLRDGGKLIEQQEAPFLWTEKIVINREQYQEELNKNSLSLFKEPHNDECDLLIGNCFDVITLCDKESENSISTIIWRIHHALIDGYSAMLVLRKVRQVAAGMQVEPSPSFVSLATKLRELQNSSRAAAQDFWQEQHEKYSSANGELLLSSPKHASSNITDTVSFRMPVDVPSLAQKCGVTLATVCYAAWALVLALYTDSDTVLFGAVLSGRNLPLPNVETTVGPLVNTLPIYIKIDSNSSVKQFLQHIFKKMLKLASFQWSLPEHGYTRQFSSALSIQFDLSDLQGEAGESIAAPIEKPYSLSHTDIPLGIFIEPDETVRMEYDSAIFHRSDMQTLCDQYRNAFSTLLNASAQVSECQDKVLTVESHQMLRTLGNCISDQTTIPSVVEDLTSLFCQTAAKYPDHIAVEKGDDQVTYSQLMTAASSIAEGLEAFIQRGDVVCIHADRSLEWIYGIYGILMAGGIYCPIDAALPQPLRNSQYQSAEAKVFLVPYEWQKTSQPLSCDTVLVLEEIIRKVQGSIVAQPDPNPLASAYICFTSGSTGKPKGVLCTHSGLVAFQRDKEVRLMSEPGCKIAQTMSAAFDGSIHEIFSALSYGATLVLPHGQDPFAHLSKVNVALFTPSVAKVLDPTNFPLLNTVYLVGEPVPQEVNDRWASQKILYNMYGPTEGTGGATIGRLLPGKAVTIGRPNPSTRVYIMDRNMCLVPPGMRGEICLAGVQVARGYMNLTAETSERFCPDLVRKELGEMIYRTGDQGYWDVETGEIVCLGRRDRQIKLCGFRLDLNDLEVRMLKAAPAVKAVAIARKNDFLVAMVTPGSVNIANFISEIRNAVPIHALPKHVFSADEFPMTMAGKLDYNAIANYTPNSSSASSPEQRPLLPIQNKVAQLWRLILGLDPKTPINNDSDFLDLGGHSVLQLHLATKLNEEFQCRIPFKIVVESSTLHSMADSIDQLLLQNSLKEQVAKTSHGQVNEHDLAPIEMEWWQKYHLDEGSSSFNVCFAAKFNPSKVDQVLLAAAWNMVMARHRILRSRYVRKGRRSGVYRKYADSPPQVQRLSRLDIWKEVNRPFNLSQNDPIRVIISKDTFLVVVSHIVCDLTTLELLHNEVVALYRGKPLKRACHNYMEVTLWNNMAAVCDFDFWTRYMADAPSTKTSFEVGVERLNYRGSSRLYRIPPSTFGSMLDIVASQRLTLHQLALAAIALAMQLDQEQIDIVLGGPHLNRKTSEAQKTVGLFLEPLPIRVKSSALQSTSTEQYLQDVKCYSQQALGRAVPWDQLLRHLGIVPDFPNHPLFDIMVTFHDNRLKDFLPLPGFQPLNLWAEGSKFKLMFEFVAVTNEDLTVRIEHDEYCYPVAVVEKISMLVLEALRLLSHGGSLHAGREQLRRWADGIQMTRSRF